MATTQTAPAPSSQKREPINIQLTFGRDNPNWNPERKAFLKMFDELIKTHANQFVVIHEGQVIASGDDELEVARAAIRQFGNQTMYMARVSKEKEICRIPSFRVVG